MSEKKMIRFGVAALIVVVLVGLGASALQQSAWSQGYMMGLIAGGDGGDGLAQYVLYNSRGISHASGFGFLFKLGFLFFLFMMGAKFFRIWSWKQHSEEGVAPWSGRWHQGPPWQQPDTPQPNKPQEESSQPEKPQKVSSQQTEDEKTGPENAVSA